MKKQSIMIALLIVLSLTLAGCGAKTEEAAPTPEPTATAEPTPTPTPEPTPTPTPAPTPEPGIVVIDEEGAVTASFGVAEGDANWERDDEPQTVLSPGNPVNDPEIVPYQEPKTQYEAFMNLSPAEKDAFKNSFGSVDAFYEWLVTAQAEQGSLPSDVIEIKPGETIDLSEFAK